MWSVMWTRGLVKGDAYFSKYMQSDLSNIFIYVYQDNKCMHEDRLFVHVKKMDAYLSVYVFFMRFADSDTKIYASSPCRIAVI